jgi:predicted membrane protein
MEKNTDVKNRDSSRVIGGLILVGVGAVLLLRNTGFYLPGWLFSWPMILILVGVYSGFKHNFRNTGWIILIGVGLFFLVSKFIPALGLQPLFWPLVIIGLGILFIVRPRNSATYTHSFNQEKWKADQRSAFDFTQNNAPAEDTDLLFVRSVFSGVRKTIVSKNFKGGTISSFFGGAEIDLSQAEINGPVTLRFEVLFGGAKIVIPSHWAVQNEIDGIFHGVDDNRRFNPNATLNPDKVLILKGSATFGGIDISSY